MKATDLTDREIFAAVFAAAFTAEFKDNERAYGASDAIDGAVSSAEEAETIAGVAVEAVQSMRPQFEEILTALAVEEPQR